MFHWPGPDARRLRVVVVARQWKAQRPTGGERRCVEWPQFGVRISADRYWAAQAMKFTAGARVILEAYQHRQHGFPTPLGISECLPFVIVGGGATQREAGVHARRPAGDLATRIRNGPASDHFRSETPIVVLWILATAQEGSRNAIDSWIVGSGFDQQYTAAAVFGEPRREHRPRGPGSNDDFVEFHGYHRRRFFLCLITLPFRPYRSTSDDSLVIRSTSITT